MNKLEIESITPREHVQLRPYVYAGDCSDATQLMIEILGNSIDEYNIGYGNTIIVSVDNENHVYSIQDAGRGFPINEMRSDGETTLQASFDVLNTSGKFREDGSYSGVSIGKNGQGGKISNFLSTKLDVLSWRNNGKDSEHVWFENGIFVKRELENNVPKTASGTIVIFTPDAKYFTSPTVNLHKVEEFCDDITCLCPGLKIILNDKEYYHENGISDMLDKNIGDSISIIKSNICSEFEDGKQKMAFGMTYTSSSSSKIISYVNCGHTLSGPNFTAIKSGITRVLNSWARENGLLKEKDKNLDGNSLQEGLVFVSNITAENVEYDAQIKTTITKIDTSFISNFTKYLEVWLDNNPEDAAAIIEKALLAKKASDAAKRAREAVKNKKRVANKVKILHPDKLKDAEYLGENSTLLCVEGLSAGASMAVARDIEKYGILMLRGKLINAFSNKDDKLLKNEEIQLLFKALNISPNQPYDSSKLRYGRVAICVDSDSDGFHIGLLLMVALQHFCPQFIEEKRLCWLRSPLYIVKNKGKESYHFTDKEMNAARPNLPAGVEVQRCKGLGSLSAEQARDSMFGENQVMDVLDPSWNAIDLLEKLMGNDVKYRKDYIFNNIDFSEVKE
jgi:DNA gyrase/topoisomerase IV subunit B